MSDLSRVKEHMEVIGADGVHVGTVDKVDGARIKLTKKDSGSHNHHHYISGGLVAAVEGEKVRLSANAANAVLLEEEADGRAIADSSGTLKKVAIGVAAAGAVAAASAVIYNKVKGKGEKDEAEAAA
jgi:hypothetical protein